jgi:hypothetical protein
VAIPSEVTAVLDAEMQGVYFGKVILEVSIHDGKPKYRITKEISIVPGKPTSGSHTKT